MRESRILIIGAGIGGLTTALALQRYGFRPAVYEAAPELNEVGAGLTVASNGSVVLAELGLGPVLDEYAVVPKRGAVMHFADGRTLVDIPRGDATRHFGAPYCQIHRADLHDGLVAKVCENDPDCIRLGSAFANFREQADSVAVRFADGSTATGDVLIGCDGIRSAVRVQMFGDDAPQFTGYAAWRGLIPMSSIDESLIVPESAIWIGPGHFLNRYKVRAGRLLNYVALVRTDRWAAEGWSVPSTVESVLAEFEAFEPRARTLIAATPPGECFQWGIFERPALDTWSTDRVTLLGDAAHPMTPFLGQGAVMALEDAMIIARAFAAAESVADGIGRYERARLERTRYAAAESRKAGLGLTTFDPDGYSAATHRNEESLGLADYNAVTVGI